MDYLSVVASLAIARIFGGFGSSFFQTYHNHRPKSAPVDQYELRVDLYELFHYLNHALLFGGVRFPLCLKYQRAVRFDYLIDRVDTPRVQIKRWTGS